MAYDLYKGPYSNFNSYSQSRDTSREDAIRRLLSFSSNQQITNDPGMADVDYSTTMPPVPEMKVPMPPKRSLYESLDNKFGGVLPGGTIFKPGDYGISEKFAENNPTISRGLATIASPFKAIMDNPFMNRSSQTAGEIVTLTDRPEKTSTGNDNRDMIADLVGGLVGFGANPESAGAKLFGLSEKAIAKGLQYIPKAENLPKILQTGAKIGGATVPYEATVAALNDREFKPGEAAEAGLSNAALAMLLHGAGSALSKRNTPPKTTDFKMPEYKEPDMSDFTPEELANFRSKSSLGEMITPETVTTKEVAAAQRTLRNTLNVEKANQILNEFPELESEFPHFRLQQGDTVILPNGKEAIVKTADKMIIQVDVDGKTVSIGRKVVKVPEVKTEVPEVVSEAMPEVPETTTPEIKQQPVISDVPRLNNRSGAETFADENIPDVSVKQEPIVAQEILPQLTGEPVKLTAEQQQSIDKLVKDSGFNSLEDARKAITSYRNMVNDGQVFYRGEMVPEGAKGKKNNIIRQKSIEDVLNWTPDNLIKKHEANIARQENIKEKAQEILDTTDPLKDYGKRDNAKMEIENSNYWIGNYQKEIDKLRKQIKNDEEISKIAEENNLLYITSQKENALSYAKQLEGKSEILFGEKPEGYNPTVYELKGKFDNTFDLTKYENGLISLDEVDNLLNDLGIKLDDKQFNEFINRLGIDEMEQNSGQVFGLFRGENLPIMLNALKKGKYDSVHYAEGLQDNWIVLDRNKVAIKDDLDKASKLDSVTQDKILRFKSGQDKPAPPEVLKDYPELSAEVGSKSTSETKVMAEDIGLKPEKAETYDEGTIGAARLTVPEKQSTLPGTDEKVRSFNVSVANSEIASPDVKIANIMEMYPGGLGAYSPIKLREVDVEAQNLISQNIEKATRFVLEGEEPSALKTATGIRLIEKYQNAGNYERAIDVSLAMAERLTKVGQEISAARIMGALKPDGILVFAQRQINKLNSGKKFGKDIELTPEMAKILKELANRLKNATDENARLEAGQELQGALNSLKPSGILRKIDSAQTISMLLNPKTLIRNTVGNEMFYRLERLNKIVATPIDWTVSKLTGADRQVTFRTAGQGGYWQGFFKGAKAGWKGVNPEGIQTQYDLGRSPAFNINPERAKNANTTTGKVVGGTFDFAEKTMAYLERTLGAALKGFDFAAYTRAKNNTIGELATLKAINTTGKADKTIVQGFMKDIEDNVLNIADQYGKYVTFQDNNVISRGLQGVKDALNINQDWGVGSVILKFPRTPGALIARGLEYSPAGFLKSAYELAKVTGIFKGNPSQRETTLALSRAITGTAGLTGLGYFLADQGIITGSIEKDKDLRDLQRQTGQGQYRINLSALSRWVQSGFNKDTAQPIAGDKIINYDWAQPIAMALSIGANISKNLNDGQGKLDNISSTIAGSLEGALNTVAEQPVLQGLTRAVQGYDMGENVTNTVKNIPSSFAPTLANQVRQYIDNTTRSTYDPSWVEESKNKVKGKIPGIAGNLPVAYDTFGKPKEIYQDGGNDAFNVFFNPAFTSKYKVPEEAKLAIETFRNTGETKQLPRVASKSFTISGQKIELTAKEYSDMQRIVGERTLKEFSRIPQNASDDKKIRRMIDALGKAGLEGRKFVLQQRGIGFRNKGNGIVLRQQ